MDEPQEVDPGGDVNITVRNQGAPSEPATAAESTVKEAPSIVRDVSTMEADGFWIQTHPTGKRRHTEHGAERRAVYVFSSLFCAPDILGTV